MKRFLKKTADISICIVFLLLSFSFFIILIFGQHEDFSERENRALQKMPTLTFSTFTNGSFFSKLSSFSADQFPLRASFCSLSSLSELALLRNECNGIIVASEGHLISRQDKSNDILSSNLDAISLFFEAQDKPPSFLMVVPRSLDVESNKLPSLFYKDYGKSSYALINDKISVKNLIDPKGKLKALSESGESVWYATDHHWTTKGAYEAYLCFCQKLSTVAYPPEYFTKVAVTNNFLGTSFSRSGLSEYFSTSDTIELYRYDENISVISPTIQKTVYGFYDLSALEKKDKYQIFLGGNTDILQIRDTEKEKPKMLLIKDSYANCLIPFLALHYDIDVIDLRYYRSSLKKITESNVFDIILVVYGIDTLSDDVSCADIVK